MSNSDISSDIFIQCDNWIHFLAHLSGNKHFVFVFASDPRVDHSSGPEASCVRVIRAHLRTSVPLLSTQYLRNPSWNIFGANVSWNQRWTDFILVAEVHSHLLKNSFMKFHKNVKRVVIQKVNFTVRRNVL